MTKDHQYKHRKVLGWAPHLATHRSPH